MAQSETAPRPSIVEATEGVAEMLEAAKDGETAVSTEVERDGFPALRDITEFKSLVVER